MLHDRCIDKSVFIDLIIKKQACYVIIELVTKHAI